MSKFKYYLKEVNFTYILIAVNIFFFVISTVLSLLIKDQSTALQILGAESFVFITQAQFWRLLVSAFLHVSIIHLGFNMYSLWILGILIERYFGSKRFLVVYVLAAIGGNLLTVMIEGLNHISNPSYNDSLSVGASGAIFGLFGLAFGATIFNKRYGLSLPIDRNNLLAVIGLNLIFDLIIPDINIFAHLGGLLVGIALALLITPLPHKVDWRDKLIEVGFYFSLFLLLASFVAEIVYIIKSYVGS